MTQRRLCALRGGQVLVVRGVIGVSRVRPGQVPGHDGQRRGIGLCGMRGRQVLICDGGDIGNGVYEMRGGQVCLDDG